MICYGFAFFRYCINTVYTFMVIKMKIIKIVITGGPCAGKSTALKYVSEHLKKRFEVLVLSETATELKNSGITPENIGHVEFQRLLFKLQMKKEEIITSAAKIQGKDTAIILDRGALDGKAYISDNDFRVILEEAAISEEEILNSYDAVFHLVTAAASGADKYTVKNNAARTETADEAFAIDIKTMNAWKKHKHFKVIQSNADFHDKINNLITEIDNIIDSEI